MYTHFDMLLFFANIRSWQLVIILLVIAVFFILIPFLMGFVAGRRGLDDKRKRNLRK